MRYPSSTDHSLVKPNCCNQRAVTYLDAVILARAIIHANGLPG